MSDPVKDAWGEVVEGFSKLGQAMKDRYLGPQHESDSSASGSAASEEGLREAFERFVAAGRDVGQRAADVVRDADVNAQAKQAASSLNDALSATVDMIGREVGALFGRPNATQDEPAAVGVPHDDSTAARPPTAGPGTRSAEGTRDVTDVDTDDGPTI